MAEPTWPPTWLPDAQDLHALILTRATGDDGAGLDAFGGNLPQFNEHTAVTAQQAERAILVAANVPGAIVGDTTRPTLHRLAAEATLCKAASRVEASLLAGQTSQSDTASAYWLKQYEMALVELRTATADAAKQDEPGPEDNVGSAGLVFASFPRSRLRDGCGWPRVL